MSHPKFSKIVGIDLGTTKSVVAVVADNQPIVIPNKEGSAITPSVVAYDQNRDCFVGDIAKRKSIINYQNTFYAAKRLIGRTFREDIRTSVSYVVEKDKWGRIQLYSPHLNTQLTPEDISSQILRKLIDDASEYIGEPIHQAVITVPAYFNPFQRQATIEAAKKIGLEVVRIINEPTAASLAYGLGAKEQTILVFDMGGGSLDVSILEIGEGVFKVLATSGNTELGGNDFDREIIDYIAEKILTYSGFDCRQNKQVLRYLMEVAERAKIELSGSLQTEIDLSLLPRMVKVLQDLENIILTKNKFEELCSNLIDWSMLPVEKAIRDAKIDKSAIDEVILVGGSTRIPAIQEKLGRILNKKLRQTVNPDRVIALGAAIQAGIIAGDWRETLLIDVTPMSLGIETSAGVMSQMVFRNTTIPMDKSEVFSTSEDYQTGVTIHVLQGEREMARDNLSLGYLEFDSIPPARRGCASN
jgi:molecular chaperone DnaK